ncbi:MAG: glycosyltransferase [Lachnospiraceae bacterium]|nr:glycosyltransferase [Lachnospiraceae bacterium]
MKLLYLEWASFGNKDMKDAFLKEGFTLVCFPFSNKESRQDKFVEEKLTEALHKETPDFIFSFNYFPLVSNVCKKENIRYISWVYDSPYVMLYSYTVINPCNTIYIFDKELCMEFQHAGIHTIHYLPMAANAERLDTLIPIEHQDHNNKTPLADTAYCTSDHSPFLYDISFVGSLYTERHNFFERMTTLSDYTKGYLDALMSAQMNIQGCNFIQDSLSPIMDDLYQALPMDPNSDGVETREYLYSQYVINRKITGLERTHILQEISARHAMDLFTHDRTFTLPNLINHGPVDNFSEMPLVFKQSRINLNISLRSIKSGIPQRAFDIMGIGGFLLSNYQADFLDDFIPGEDFDYYESTDDLLAKIDYYLAHDDERAAISKNGHEKIVKAHTYRHRVREMLAT